MKWLQVSICAVLILGGCDSGSDTGSKSANFGSGLSGVWGTTLSWGPPKLVLDIESSRYVVYAWELWSYADGCYGVREGDVSTITNDYLILDGYGDAVQSASGDTFYYNATADTLIRPAPPGYLGHYWVRLGILESEIDPLCTTLREQLVGQWELTGIADGSGDVFPAWEQRFSSFVLIIDQAGHGTATLTSVSGGETLFGMYTYGGGATGGMVLLPENSQAKLDFDMDIGADEVKLTFSVSPHLWNLYFGMDLGDDAAITLIRTSK